MMEHCRGNKKLLGDVQTVLENSRHKIDFIHMQLLRLRNVKTGVTDEDRNNFSSCFFLLWFDENLYSPHSLKYNVINFFFFFDSMGEVTRWCRLHV